MQMCQTRGHSKLAEVPCRKLWQMYAAVRDRVRPGMAAVEIPDHGPCHGRYRTRRAAGARGAAAVQSRAITRGPHAGVGEAAVSAVPALGPGGARAPGVRAAGWGVTVAEATGPAPTQAFLYRRRHAQALLRGNRIQPCLQHPHVRVALSHSRAATVQLATIARLLAQTYGS